MRICNLCSSMFEFVNEEEWKAHKDTCGDVEEGQWNGYVFLNVYLKNREYGGPEEGGWFYDTGRFIKSYPIKASDDEVRAKYEAIKARLDERNKEEGNHEPGSVLCDGYLVVSREGIPGADYPRNRPHYE